MEQVIDLINQLLKYNDNEISYVIDKDEVFWFRFKDVANILGIKEAKKSLKLIDEGEKNHYKDLQAYNKPRMHGDTVYITETGLYDFLIRSTMPIAREFQKWLTKEVLPQLRKQGIFALNQTLTTKVKTLEAQLKAVQNELKKFTNQQNKKEYEKGSYVYIIDLEDSKEIEEKVYKIGKTDDPEKRLRDYNVGRTAPIDFLYIKKTENALCVEGCVRALLREYRYGRSRDKFQCNLQLIIDMMEDCIKSDRKCHMKCSKDSIPVVENNLLRDTSKRLEDELVHVISFVKK